MGHRFENSRQIQHPQIGYGHILFLFTGFFVKKAVMIKPSAFPISL
jgi:hypothetical protein